MELVAAGKFTRTFGNEGGVTAILYDRFPDKFDKKEPLYVRLDGLEVPFFVSHFERRGKNGAFMVLDDIDSQQRTAIVTGHEFLLKPGHTASSPATGDDLSAFAGYTAVLSEEDGKTGSVITGIITTIAGNDANPLFVIDSAGREILIPAAEDMVEAIDPDKQTIFLVVPPGLLDLQ